MTFLCSFFLRHVGRPHTTKARAFPSAALTQQVYYDSPSPLGPVFTIYLQNFIFLQLGFTPFFPGNIDLAPFSLSRFSFEWVEFVL